MTLPVDVGTGTTIVFQTSSFSAEIVDIQIGGISREAVDVTEMSDVVGAGNIGGREFIPTRLADPGELTLEVHFDPDDTPPVNLPAEVIDITFPQASGETTPTKWSATGFCTSYDAAVPLEDKMTATITIKITGDITITPAT